MSLIPQGLVPFLGADGAVKARDPARHHAQRVHHCQYGWIAWSKGFLAAEDQAVDYNQRNEGSEFLVNRAEKYWDKELAKLLAQTNEKILKEAQLNSGKV